MADANAVARDQLRSDLGLNIHTKHEDIRTSDGSPSVSSSPAESEPEEISASHSKMDRATEGSFETGSEAAEKGREAIPAGPEGADLSHAGAGESPATLSEQTAEQAEGGEHEVATGSAPRAGLADPTSNTGEGEASAALPAKSKLRPHCQRPGNTCGGYGDKHCHACLRAMREYEAA